MEKMLQGIVFVLVGYTLEATDIVAVFARHQDAVKYATEHHVQGWHVLNRTFYAPKII